MTATAGHHADRRTPSQRSPLEDENVLMLVPSRVQDGVRVRLSRQRHRPNQDLDADLPTPK
jgi:hypothetical protein